METELNAANRDMRIQLFSDNEKMDGQEKLHAEVLGNHFLFIPLGLTSCFSSSEKVEKCAA